MEQVNFVFLYEGFTVVPLMRKPSRSIVLSEGFPLYLQKYSSKFGT